MAKKSLRTIADLMDFHDTSIVEIQVGARLIQGADTEELHSVSIVEAMLGMVDAVRIAGMQYRPIYHEWVKQPAVS